MTQAHSQLFYVGSFCSEFPNLHVNNYNKYNGGPEEGRQRRNADTVQRSFEESVVELVELAQLNGILPVNGQQFPVDLQVDGNCVRLTKALSPVPFERIPLHKIVHSLLYNEEANSSKALLLMENGCSFGGSNKLHRGQDYKFHLFRSAGSEERARAFCQQLQAKFDEILSNVLTTAP